MKKQDYPRKETIRMNSMKEHTEIVSSLEPIYRGSGVKYHVAVFYSWNKRSIECSAPSARGAKLKSIVVPYTNNLEK